MITQDELKPGDVVYYSSQHAIYSDVSAYRVKGWIDGNLVTHEINKKTGLESMFFSIFDSMNGIFLNKESAKFFALQRNEKLIQQIQSANEQIRSI